MKHRPSPILHALACLAAAAGCSNPGGIDEPRQVLFVESFLTPGSDIEVRLRLTLPPEQFWEGREETVSGAEVVVSTGESRVVLDERTDSPGTYAAGHGLLPVVEGETYRLEVRHGERLLRTQTTVPWKAAVLPALGDTITYLERFGDRFGDLDHPGEFSWESSPTAAGYIVVVEALEVKSLPVTAEPLTADLDSLTALRQRLSGQVDADSLAALDGEIRRLRDFLEENISLVRGDGSGVRWLRDREQEDWDEIDGKDWSEGRKWRQKRRELNQNRVFEYWMPADSTRSDFWWLGVRFEGEYEVAVHAADRNYLDYFRTVLNGVSGADSDTGPIFHVDGGAGVFGSYAADGFRLYAEKGENGNMKVTAYERSRPWREPPP